MARGGWCPGETADSSPIFKDLAEVGPSESLISFYSFLAPLVTRPRDRNFPGHALGGETAARNGCAGSVARHNLHRPDRTFWPPGGAAKSGRLWDQMVETLMAS
jgi:hypothetical protein